MTFPNVREPALSYPMPIPTGTLAGGQGLQVIGGDALLVGWSFVETTGAAAAVCELYDGGGGNGTLIAVIALSAGQSVTDLAGPLGVLCRSGVWLNVVSGSVRGSVWVVDL